MISRLKVFTTFFPANARADDLPPPAPPLVGAVKLILEKLFSWIRAFYDWVPSWARVTIAAAGLLIVLTLAIRNIYGKKKFDRKVADFAYWVLNVFSSFRHNYGGIVNDGLVISALLTSGYKLHDTIAGNHTWIFWISTGVGVGTVFRKQMKALDASGREFKVFFENRARAAQIMSLHNEKYPPQPRENFNYRTSPITKDFVTDILEGHLAFLHQLLRLGFSRHGKDWYSASLLIYDSKRQEWHKWDTAYEFGTDPRKVRKGSSWPKAKSAFYLPTQMYSRHRTKLFHVQQLDRDHYKAFLTVPLYYRRNGDEAHSFEKKDDLFAAISYSNSNPETFKNLKADKFLKYFAQEVAVIERIAFRIYRDYNF